VAAVALSSACGPIGSLFSAEDNGSQGFGLLDPKRVLLISEAKIIGQTFLAVRLVPLFHKVVDLGLEDFALKNPFDEFHIAILFYIDLSPFDSGLCKLPGNSM